MVKSLAVLIALNLAASPSAASPVFTPLNIEGAAVTGWTPAAPDDDPNENVPGAPERAGFWDRMQDKAFDQICKNIKLKQGQKLDLPGAGAAGVSVQRYMQRTAAGTFALVDRAEISLDAGYGQSIFDSPNGPVSISVGASIRGESVVVRPLGTKKSCDELGRLANLFDIKTAVPLSPERISRMEIGEIWKLPLTLHIGAGIGTGLRFDEVPVAISLGRGKSTRASVTLYRMAEDQLRFRLRVDKMDIRDKGGDIVYSVPGALLGFPETETVVLEQLVRLVNRQIAKTISRYLTARVGLHFGKRQGRQLMIEFVLDPNDAESMAALRQLMRGDLNALSVLQELLRRASRVFDKDQDARQEAGELRDRHAGELGKDASFVGADDYTRDSSRFGFKIPILVDYDRINGRERDRIVIVDEKGGQFDVHKADKRNETGLIDVPFLGELHKHNKQRTAQVITYRDAAGKVSEPVAVFVRQEGFLRSNSTTARNMVVEADAIMRLAGTRGEGENAETSLPVDELFPQEELYLPERGGGPRSGDHGGPQAKSYHRGISAFTLVFSQKAIKDILAASVETVYKSFIRTLQDWERRLIAKVMPVAALRADGALDYKTHDALKALGHWSWHDEEARDDMNTLSSLAHKAAMICRDLAAVRQAKTAEERAEKFLAVLAGDGKSKLAYEAILKVLVQMVDPADMAGEFFINVEKKRKDEKDVATRLVLNDKLDNGGIIAGASRNRARFAEPSVLTD
ncbi:MAG: hypothetical protein ABIJ96_00870 [Elusimicrobiota bacterium]